MSEVHLNANGSSGIAEGERRFTGQLLTGPGRELEVAPEDRRLVAVFAEGIAVVAHGCRWDSEIKAVFDRAYRARIEISEIVEAETEEILAAYHSHAESQTYEGQQENPIERQQDLRRIIGQAAFQKASDIHVQVHFGYSEVRIRVHGRLRRMVSRTQVDGIALINAAFAVAAGQGSQSGSGSFMKGVLTRKSGLLPAGIDLARLQYSPTSRHAGTLVMRLKYAAGKGEFDVETLGYLAPQARDYAIMRRRTSGLYLLAGKVSSGKTTTLQRVLNAMVREKQNEIAIYAIEEPVELEVSGGVHVSLTDRSGQSRSEMFLEAIKAALRSDPNVVVLGELRDRESASYAIELAMTGHALWSTIHAGSALGILDRLTDLGIEGWKLSEPSIVSGLAYQRLVGSLCKSCRLPYASALSESLLARGLAESVMDITDRRADQLFVRGPGCPDCDSGLTGRSVVAETVIPDPMLLEYFLGGDRRAMRAYWLAPNADGGLGGIPVMHHAMIKVGRGQCDINEIEEEIDLVANYQRDFGSHVARLRADIRSAERILQ